MGFCIADTGAGVFTEQVLVHMALRLQHFRHAMVGFQSVVHAVTHDVRVEAVAVTNDHEKSDRFFLNRSHAPVWERRRKVCTPTIGDVNA